MRSTEAAFPYAMPSNNAPMSAGDSALARIIRTEGMESAFNAPRVSPISCWPIFHSGFQASSGFQDIHVANPSFSHIVPPLHGDQVSKPLVSHLVRNDAGDLLFRVVGGGLLVDEKRTVAIRDGRHIF